MSHTVAAVTVAGRPYTILGPVKETVTDVTVTSTSGSETLTPADVRLNAIFDGRATVTTTITADTVVDWFVAPNADGTATLSGQAIAAGAGTGHNGTVIRVWARGY